MTRKQLREAIFKLVFERCVTNQFNGQTLTELVEGEDAQYAKTVTDGIDQNFEFLKTVISDYAEGFTYERIFKTDLAIMTLAIYEILFSDVPQAVAANEAVELAKTYSADKSPAFINGILASVITDKEELIKKSATYGESKDEHSADN